MTLATFVKLIKRKARKGTLSNTSDQVTADIVEFYNNRALEFWRHWPWHFVLAEISFTTAVGKTDYTMASDVGDIIALDAGNDDYLVPVSFKEYLRWKKRANQAAGTVTHYLKIGRDSSDNIKLRLWRPPSSIKTITGWGKKRLTTYTTSDIATNTGLEYFPKEAQPVLFDGVLADVYETDGKEQLAFAKDAKFEVGLKMFRTEEDSKPDEEIVAPVPDAYRWRQRRRGGTTVV